MLWGHRNRNPTPHTVPCKSMVKTFQVVLSFFLNSTRIAVGASFPSTKSTKNIIINSTQHAAWNLFPCGCGFHGHQIQPRQVQWLCHNNIYSPRHITQPERKTFHIWAFQALIIWQPPKTCQQISLELRHLRRSGTMWFSWINTPTWTP